MVRVGGVTAEQVSVAQSEMRWELVNMQSPVNKSLSWSFTVSINDLFLLILLLYIIYEAVHYL